MSSDWCVVFGSLPFKHFLCPRWLLVQPHQEQAAPASPPSGVVQIHLQGTPARSGSTRVPRPRGRTLAAEHGERGGRQDKGNWEKHSQDTNPTTHRCYKSHSPTPFGQTNLKTYSLTRLSLRTSLDHGQVSPIYSVIFILCKQGCVEFFFLFFPKDKCSSLLNTPSLNLHQHPQLSKKPHWRSHLTVLWLILAILETEG